MNKQEVLTALQNKQGISIAVPSTLDTFSSEASCYFIELFDCISAYLNPIEYAISKEDIVDYLETETCDDFFEFLHFKRYFVLESDFDILYNKYFGKREATSIFLHINSQNYSSFVTAVNYGASLSKLITLFG